VTAHSKLDVASAQLKTAVLLFVTDQDRISSITLAGAADVILSQLLLNAGKPNFSDQLMKLDADKTGVIPNRSEHGRAVNDMLMINALKHMDSGDDEYVEMDLFVSSMATVAKAVANYVALCGDDVDFVHAFKLWAQVHTPRGLDQDGVPIK
jgi:hypothetical protein